jgi:LmbE family N-acetylglucosaminyl deacetylase
VTSPALFCVAHPDDEVLAMSVAIAEHLEAGQDVHIWLATRGKASSVRDMLNGVTTSAWWRLPHDLQAEGYQPLSADAFGAARMREAEAAIRCLAAGYPGSVTIHEGGLADGAVTQAGARAAIEAVCDSIAPGGGPVRLKAHSPLVDNSSDHLAIGKAVAAMTAADPARFGGARYYLLPDYWADSRLSQVAEMVDLPGNTGVTDRVRNAIRAYGSWQPMSGSFAVGQHSVPGMFAALYNTPKCVYHT